LSSLCQLKIELAAVVDQFVKDTYNLEGDGALCWCYEEIVRVIAYISSGNYANIRAFACSLASGNPIVEHQGMSYAVSCIQPGIGYFYSKLFLL